MIVINMGESPSSLLPVSPAIVDHPASRLTNAAILPARHRRLRFALSAVVNAGDVMLANLYPVHNRYWHRRAR